MASGLVLASALPVTAATCPMDPAAEATPDVDWSGCDLAGERLIGVNLAGANLTGANLTAAFVVLTRLSGANLTGAILTGATVSSVFMDDVDLTGAILIGAYMDYSDLTGADLSGVDLTRASMNSVNVAGASLSGAFVACGTGGVLGSDVGGLPVSLPDGWALTDGVLTVPVVPCPPGVSGVPIPAWVQAYGRDGSDAPCPDGWSQSWQAWAEPVSGGWVCTRSLPSLG